MERQLLQVPAFRGVAGFLSNFSPYQRDEYFVWEGITYISNEHFYQAMKVLDIPSRRKIADHVFSGLKKFTRTFEIDPNWDKNKEGIMWQGLQHKFSQSRYKELLLSTGDLELVERNTWKDTYWGVYMGWGKNRLGQMLMDIRKSLQ